MIVIGLRSLIAAALAALVFWLLTAYTALNAPMIIFFTLWVLLIIYAAPLNIKLGE